MNRELAKECLEALEHMISPTEEGRRQVEDLHARLRAAIEEPTREEVIDWALSRNWDTYPRISEESVPSEAEYFVFYEAPGPYGYHRSIEHYPVPSDREFAVLLAAYKKSKQGAPDA